MPDTCFRGGPAAAAGVCWLSSTLLGIPEAEQPRLRNTIWLLDDAGGGFARLPSALQIGHIGWWTLLPFMQQIRDSGKWVASNFRRTLVPAQHAL